MSYSNYISNILALIGIVFLSLSSCSQATPSGLRAKGYIITKGDSASSERWSEYLYSHLSKRANDKSIVLLKSNPKEKTPIGFIDITIRVDENLQNDYCIVFSKNQLTIQVKTDKVALWISYQLISKIAEENSLFTADDLPPAIVEFIHSECRDFDFDYREPYFTPNLDIDKSSILGTNSVETDWGLWGHNLKKIMKDSDDRTIYALVDGKHNLEQFSFSSPVLLEKISDYIVDNFGDGEEKQYRFMIMPNDNDLVCTCEACLKLGNTKQNATPAVTDLLKKLSKRFPKHQFFTSAYRTTSAPPSEILPNNIGVFFSTINLPKGVIPDVNTHKVQTFIKDINAWSSRIQNIYLWDYTSNFDDYLTPLPDLLGLQKQLEFFKRHNIKGIFYNASGYDYSSFEDLKTFIIASLMIDVTIDVKRLSKLFFKRNYPKNHSFLSEYYLDQTEKYFQKNKPYDMYGGIQSNIKTYLNTDDFISFYNHLGEVIKDKNIGEEELEKLKKLYIALTFTRLQIAYLEGNNQWGYARREGNKIFLKNEIEEFINNLEKHKEYPELTNYKEFNGSLKEYINQWKNLKEQQPFENEILDKEIKIHSQPDEGFEKPILLNDGTPGFPQDYHQGWYLSSVDDLDVSFRVNNLQGKKRLHLRFLNNPQHKIYPPQTILLFTDEKLVKKIDYNMLDFSENTAETTIDIDLSEGEEIRIQAQRKEDKKSILACDEIQILN